ncbi:uncharacterized protein [Diabrotica undecimpunctata]|uniref:uncharacterized protein n=1 Tax=Diabrotica undecimpunctata TaxID=50387 RepID=UPI003B63B550
MHPSGRGKKIIEMARELQIASSDQLAKTVTKATDEINVTETITLITILGESVTSRDVPITVDPIITGHNIILQDVTNSPKVGKDLDQYSVIVEPLTSKTDSSNKATDGAENNPALDQLDETTTDNQKAGLATDQHLSAVKPSSTNTDLSNDVQGPIADQQLSIEGPSTSNTNLRDNQIFVNRSSSNDGSEYDPVYNSHSEGSDENSTDSSEAELDPNNHNINEGRKRRNAADPSQWKRNKNKKLRMEGKPYLGFMKGQTGKYEQLKQKDARHMQPTCDKEVCRKSKFRYCSEFSEDVRKRIFEHFWKITWEQRHAFVAAHVKHINKIKNTVHRDDSRRTKTLQYRLNNGQEQLQVCRQMFLDTLGIKYRMVQYWVKQSSFEMPHAPGGKRYKTDQKLLDNIDFLDNFLNALSKMPSHYARKCSSKLYLEPTFHIMDVYKFYLSKCEQETVGCVSRTTFSAMIVKKNISILPTKKDQCNTCASYRSGNIMENIWQDHINKKDTARAAKDKDKNEAAIGSQITLELDVL